MTLSERIAQKAATISGLSHTCPDGSRARLWRDAAPIGLPAVLRCRTCGYAYDAAEHERARTVLQSPFTRRALRGELPAKEVR